MKLKQVDIAGKDSGTVNVPDGLLDVTPRRDVLHAVVVWQQAKKRRHTAHTKTRSEVRGGGAKPWRQKGTGRARAGTRRSPLWRGGGTTFGPRTKQVSPKLPKKVRRLGLRMALADRAVDDQLKVVKGLQFEAPNTRQAKDVVKAAGGKRTLVVVGDGRQASGVPSPTERGFRNLDGVRVLQAEGINVYDILAADVVLLADNAVEKVFSRLSGAKAGN